MILAQRCSDENDGFGGVLQYEKGSMRALLGASGSKAF